MSRPWNVADTGSSAYSRFVISWAASIPPSFSAAGTSNPLSGPTYSRPSPDRIAISAPIAADPGIDDGEMDALRQVRKRVREHERALEDALRLDAVRDVDDLGLRRDPLHHAVAGPDEIVLEPEVGQERDQHVSPTLTNRPPRRGRRGRASSPPRRPGGRRSASRVVCGPIETTGMSAPTAANDWRPSRRRARRRRPREARPAGRAASCREGRSRPRAPRSGPRRAPSAAAKRTRPSGRGNSARRPSCDETLGTNAGSTPSSRSVSAVPGPTAATFGSAPLRAPTSSGRRSGSSRSPSRSPRRRPARPVGSISISGHSTTSWPGSSRRRRAARPARAAA